MKGCLFFSYVLILLAFACVILALSDAARDVVYKTFSFKGKKAPSASDLRENSSCKNCIFTPNNLEDNTNNSSPAGTNVWKV